MKIIKHENFSIPVVYEDEYILAVIKPYNLLIQKDISGDISLYDIIKKYFDNSFVGIIHRLDKVVYGIVLFAKTKKIAGLMFDIMKNKKLNKVYYAITEGTLNKKKDKLTHYILKKDKRAIVFSKKQGDSKLAVLEYEVEKEINNKSLIKIILHTGRYNQIRAQLAYIRHPTVGDYKYKKENKKIEKIALVAKELNFIHPVLEKKIHLNIDFPEDWDKFYI